MAPRTPGLRKETTDLGTLFDQVIEQFQRQDAEIQFDGEPFDALLADGPFAVPIEVTDGVGIRQAFTKVNIVRVKIVGGSAPGRELALGSTGGIPGPTNQKVDIGLKEHRDPGELGVLQLVRLPFEPKIHRIMPMEKAEISSK